MGCGSLLTGLDDFDNAAVTFGGHFGKGSVASHFVAALNHGVTQRFCQLRRGKPGPGQFERRTKLVEICRHAALTASNVKRHTLSLNGHSGRWAKAQGAVNILGAGLTIGDHVQGFAPRGAVTTEGAVGAPNVRAAFSRSTRSAFSRRLPAESSRNS